METPGHISVAINNLIKIATVGSQRDIPPPLDD
jgi:hypothetical protein